MDDNVGRLLDNLNANDLTKNTVVIYTPGQGFFLGLMSSLPIPALQCFDRLL